MGPACLSKSVFLFFCPKYHPVVVHLLKDAGKGIFVSMTRDLKANN
jgi:hypothetical protein